MSVVINPRNSPAPLLTRQRVEVTHNGPMVRLTVGNSHMDFPYETALQLAAWLRMHGSMAKNEAGDTSRTWNVIGVLEGVKE